MWCIMACACCFAYPLKRINTAIIPPYHNYSYMHVYHTYNAHTQRMCITHTTHIPNACQQSQTPNPALYTASVGKGTHQSSNSFSLFQYQWTCYWQKLAQSSFVSYPVWMFEWYGGVDVAICSDNRRCSCSRWLYDNVINLVILRSASDFIAYLQEFPLHSYYKGVFRNDLLSSLLSELLRMFKQLLPLSALVPW